MHFNPVVQQARGQAVQLCNGPPSYASGQSPGGPVAQRAGRLYIGAESRLSGCATGKLILTGYTSR